MSNQEKVPLVSTEPVPGAAMQPQMQYTEGGLVSAQPTMVIVQPAQCTEPAPKDHLVMSVFTMLCCCMPLGLIALIKSIESRSAYQNGRYQDAVAASQSARHFNKLALIIGVVILLVTLVIVLVAQLGWIIPLAVYGD